MVGRSQMDSRKRKRIMSTKKKILENASKQQENQGRSLEQVEGDSSEGEMKDSRILCNPGNLSYYIRLHNQTAPMLREEEKRLYHIIQNNSKIMVDGHTLYAVPIIQMKNQFNWVDIDYVRNLVEQQLREERPHSSFKWVNAIVEDFNESPVGNYFIPLQEFMENHYFGTGYRPQLHEGDLDFESAIIYIDSKPFISKAMIDNPRQPLKALQVAMRYIQRSLDPRTRIDVRLIGLSVDVDSIEMREESRDPGYYYDSRDH